MKHLKKINEWKNDSDRELDADKSNDSLFSMIDYLESEGFELSKVEFYPANLEKYDNLSYSYQKAYIKDNKLYSLSSDMDLSDREILNLKLNFK